MTVDVSFAAVGGMICVSRTSYARSLRPSCCRGNDPPEGGIMPHDGKSCQEQTAFRPAPETPATRRIDIIHRVQSHASGSLRQNVARRGQNA